MPKRDIPLLQVGGMDRSERFSDEDDDREEGLDEDEFDEPVGRGGRRGFMAGDGYARLPQREPRRDTRPHSSAEVQRDERAERGDPGDRTPSRRPSRARAAAGDRPGRRIQFAVGTDSELSELERPPLSPAEKKKKERIRELRRKRRARRVASLLGWFFGVQPHWSSFLEHLSHDYPILKILDFVDYTLRGIAQVTFANNSISGILVLAGLYVSGQWTGTMGLLGAVCATLVGALVGDRGLLRAGLYGYNGNLVGIGLATFLSPPWWAPTIFLVMFASAMSTLMGIAMSKVMKAGLPGLTWAFNIVTILMLSAMFNSSYIPTDPTLISPHLPTQNLAVGAPFDFTNFIHGTLKGVSQIWFAGELNSAILIIVGLGICSPLLAVLCMTGSLIASLTVLALGAPYSLIYAGLAGFNAALCMPAICAVFTLLQVRSALVATGACVLSVLVFLALRTFFAAVSMPAFTFPFCITTTAVLLLRGAAGAPSLGLVPIPLAYITTPEEHLYRASKFRKYIHRWFARVRFLRYRPRPQTGASGAGAGAQPSPAAVGAGVGGGPAAVQITVEKEPQLTGIGQPGSGTPPDRSAGHSTASVPMGAWM